MRELNWGRQGQFKGEEVASTGNHTSKPHFFLSIYFCVLYSQMALPTDKTGKIRDAINWSN